MDWIEYGVYVHAALGGLALLAGAIALGTKKGSKGHIQSGKLFFYSMLTSAFTAIVISVLPEHENPFLFTIGIFSSYLTITGKRAVKFKSETVNLGLDKTLAYLMLVTGIGMILFPIIYFGELNIVLTVFGSIGLMLAIQDLLAFRKPENLRSKWLQAHLGKICGGYISAVTAFIVVNDVFHPLVNWLAPTVIGTTYIIYWTRKVSKA